MLGLVCLGILTLSRAQQVIGPQTMDNTLSVVSYTTPNPSLCPNLILTLSRAQQIERDYSLVPTISRRPKYSVCTLSRAQQIHTDILPRLVNILIILHITSLA